MAVACILMGCSNSDVDESTSAYTTTAPQTSAVINLQGTEEEESERILVTREETTEEVTTTLEETTEEETTVSPSIGLTALAVVPNYVNVRTGPSTEYDIVGKIYNNCAATIMDEVDGEGGKWFLMTSGNCTGYIKAEFFLVGDAAEAMKEQVGVKKGRVVDDYLRVRSTPDLNTLDNVVTYYRTGTEVAILELTEDGFAKIETDAISTGYVYAECLDIWTEFDTAITLEEEQAEIARRQAAEEAARKAQEEYEAALRAAEEAERLAAEQAAAEAQRLAEEQAAAIQAQIDAETALRNAIVAYALQFEGNPYVHAGRSLITGTDCSGFTHLVYENFGYTLSYTPAGQSEQGHRIELSELQPGDLLFYSNNIKYLGHVAMYIGNGKIIHAASETYGICIWDYNYRDPLFAVSIID